MKRTLVVCAIVALIAAAVMWQIDRPTLEPTITEAVGSAPAGHQPKGLNKVVERGWAPIQFPESSELAVIDLADVPTAEKAARDGIKRGVFRGDSNPEMPISEEEAARRRAEALNTPFSPNIQVMDEQNVATKMATVNAVGEGPDATQCCGGGTSVPPDPEVAVGPNHVISVVNTAFRITDRNNGSTQDFLFESFFSGTANCTGVFDPNVVYDESTDRFILGIDADGTHYCIAASASGSVSSWNSYSFQTVNRRREFFDYPHIGVGVDGIYMGANMFRGNRFLEGRIWAINKSDLYSGAGSLQIVQSDTNGESTPQPSNAKGVAEGTFPTSGPQYFITDDAFNGATYAVWSWANAFNGSGGTLTREGSVDLVAATGVAAGFPIAAPQANGNNLQANDIRVQDAEFRGGLLYMSNTIACNPGSGSVNCARWAVINPAGPSVVDAGVIGSNGEHRTFADVAPNACGDIAIGYTKTSSSMRPGVYVAGRQAGDPAGTMQAEMVCKSGTADYTAFDSPPHRWGDYTEMSIAPDGSTFVYLGEYSKNIPGQARWGTFICEMSFPCSP